MAKVAYDDLELAVDFVSSGAAMGDSAYISRDTGHIYWVSDNIDSDEEELPEDLQTSDRYLAVPRKNELDLGRRLVTRFVRQAMPDKLEQVDNIFRRKGAYARFKDLLEAQGQLEHWYRFEQAATKQALRAWCADNDIEIIGLREQPAADSPPVLPHIRPVMLADAAAIAAIYNPYVRDTVISFEQTPVTDADMAQRVRDTSAQYPWLVAEVDNKVVAYAYATRWRSRAAYDATLESTIYVDENYTGRGIAQPLYMALLDELRSRGIHAVIGCIALPNDASVALHEKCGFVKVAHFPQVGRKFERWVDVGFWQATFL